VESEAAGGRAAATMPGSRSDEPLPKSNSAGPGAAAAAAAAAACIAGTCPAHMACRARASLHWQCAWQKPSHWAGAVATCAVPNATGQAASAPCRSTLPAHLPTLAWARTWHIVKCWLPTTAQSSDAHQRLASAEVPLQHSPVICAERSAGQAQRRSRRAESCHKAAQAGVQRPQLCRHPAPRGPPVWGAAPLGACGKAAGTTMPAPAGSVDAAAHHGARPAGFSSTALHRLRCRLPAPSGQPAAQGTRPAAGWLKQHQASRTAAGRCTGPRSGHKPAPANTAGRSTEGWHYPARQRCQLGQVRDPAHSRPERPHWPRGRIWCMTVPL